MQGSKNGLPSTSALRCRGITARGARCRHSAQTGSSYCRLHQLSDNEVKESPSRGEPSQPSQAKTQAHKKQAKEPESLKTKDPRAAAQEQEHSTIAAPEEVEYRREPRHNLPVAPQWYFPVSEESPGLSLAGPVSEVAALLSRLPVLPLGSLWNASPLAGLSFPVPGLMAWLRELFALVKAVNPRENKPIPEVRLVLPVTQQELVLPAAWIKKCRRSLRTYSASHEISKERKYTAPVCLLQRGVFLTSPSDPPQFVGSLRDAGPEIVLAAVRNDAALFMSWEPLLSALQSAAVDWIVMTELVPLSWTPVQRAAAREALHKQLTVHQDHFKGLILAAPWWAKVDLKIPVLYCRGDLKQAAARIALLRSKERVAYVIAESLFAMQGKRPLGGHLWTDTSFFDHYSSCEDLALHSTWLVGSLSS